MKLLGVDLDTGQVYNETQVSGAHEVNFLEKINAINQKVLNPDADDVYQVMIGQNNDFVFDHAACVVLSYYNPVFLRNAPIRVVNKIDLTQPVILDRVIGNNTVRWIMFVNGYACYMGAGNTASWAPFPTSVVPADQRNRGFIFLAVEPGSLGVSKFVVDRVKLTFTCAAGEPVATEDVWLTLPKNETFSESDTIFFDRYGACYNEPLFNRDSFWSSFSIFESAGFNQGAIANELYTTWGRARQQVEFLNVRVAEGFDLDHLGEYWFGILRRAGETDDNYRLRIIAAVVGEKCTAYAIRQALLGFSDLVLVLEGNSAYGSYNRSFYRFPDELFATGVYTDIVKRAYYGSNSDQLLRIRIIIESNPITEDPVNAKFIYDLVRQLVLAGVFFEIQKV